MAAVDLPANPAQYIAALPPDHRAAIAALHAAITKAGPKLTAKIWPISAQGMIGYGSYHYVYASKREGDWPIIALASQKNHLSLYLMASDERGYLAEQSKESPGQAPRHLVEPVQVAIPQRSGERARLGCWRRRPADVSGNPRRDAEDSLRDAGAPRDRLKPNQAGASSGVLNPQ